MSRVVRALLSCVLAAGPLWAATPALPDGVRVMKQAGLGTTVVVDALDAETRATIVPESGGRIMLYSYKLENLIYETMAGANRAGELVKDRAWVGGYQCDVGPISRALPDHFELWVGPYAWTAPRDFTVNLTSPEDKTLGLQLGKQVVLDPESGALGLTQWMKNISDKEAAYSLWDRTMCKPGGFVLMPASRKGRFPARWAVQSDPSGRGTWNGTNPVAAPVRLIGDVVVAQTGGNAARIGTDSDAGWIAYTKGNLLFVKFFPVQVGAEYADGGVTAQAYFDQSMTSLEPMGPLVKLAPGATSVLPENWVLLPVKKPVHDHEEARALVKRIPPSPFRKSK